MSKTGRPTKYNPEICELATQFCLLGATDEELAAYFGIALSTLHLWKLKHPEFSDALKEGKEGADGRVAKSLYDKALAGDTTACIFWLKNRRKQHWRDAQTHEHGVTEDLAGIIAAARKRVDG